MRTAGGGWARSTLQAHPLPTSLFRGRCALLHKARGAMGCLATDAMAGAGIGGLAAAGRPHESTGLPCCGLVQDR